MLRARHRSEIPLRFGEVWCGAVPSRAVLFRFVFVNASRSDPGDDGIFLFARRGAVRRRDAFSWGGMDLTMALALFLF